jgi:hypothetical protein
MIFSWMLNFRNCLWNWIQVYILFGWRHAVLYILCAVLCGACVRACVCESVSVETRLCLTARFCCYDFGRERVYGVIRYMGRGSKPESIWLCCIVKGKIHSATPAGYVNLLFGGSAGWVWQRDDRFLIRGFHIVVDRHSFLLGLPAFRLKCSYRHVERVMSLSSDLRGLGRLDCLILKMKGTSFVETSITTHQATRHEVQEDLIVEWGLAYGWVSFSMLEDVLRLLLLGSLY